MAVKYRHINTFLDFRHSRFVPFFFPLQSIKALIFDFICKNTVSDILKSENCVLVIIVIATVIISLPKLVVVWWCAGPIINYL